MKRLNNKGYLLVEIILAFGIAMTIMYFVTELTIKIKNRNDDLLVKTLTATDQTIIYNIIMREVYNGTTFKCSDVTISGRKLKYKDKSIIVNDYVDENNFSCSGNAIKISVNALPNENFNVVIPS